MTQTSQVKCWKRHHARLALVLLVGVLAPPLATAQAGAEQTEARPAQRGAHHNVLMRDGAGTVYQVFGPDGSAASMAVGRDATRDVILTLREPPLARTLSAHVRERNGLRARSSGRLPASVATRLQSLEAGHARFREVLTSITGEAVRVRSGLAGKTKVRREYLRALNGFALRAPASVIDRLRGHPDVEAVYEDRPVHALLEDSVPLIEAPSLWGEGATGSGVVVGILDSGVDYTHPDLGGGFGPSFKVIGGHDFVNDDADPVDDYGHGTHVAGIVAANGALRGVAPDASLVAYKVLDATGSGRQSDIVAAIERAIDPDGDPTTDDALDIINLSLGGMGDPGDPVSTAVDMAFDAGILPVVSAGNGGDAYLTVASPGCARKALTVGASDKYDQIAHFSSRGPSPVAFGLKPDLVAPGVDITSTMPYGQHAPSSGTSMAAPHVAGAAALLLQRDPTLAPADLKSLLMSGARDLGADPFVQGTGRLDVAASAAHSTVLDPPSISFGMVDPAVPVFAASATVTVRNRGATQRSYDVDLVADGLPDGLDVSLSATSLVLAPGASGAVTVDLVLDNTLVPKLQDPPQAYLGVLRVADALEEVVAPFSVIKGSVLDLSFDLAPSAVTVFDDSGHVWPYWFPGEVLRLLVPGDSYHVLALFDEIREDGPPRHFAVLREGVSVDAPQLIRRTEATREVSFELRGERNQEVPLSSVSWLIRSDSSNFGTSGWTAPGGEQYFTDLPERYHFDWALEGGDGSARYTVGGHQRGLSGDETFSNLAEDLKRVDLTFDLAGPPESYGAAKAIVQAFGQSTTWIVGQIEEPAPLRQMHYAAFDASPDSATLGFQVDVREAGDPFDWFGRRVIHSTPIYRPHDDVTDLLNAGSLLWDPHEPMETTVRTRFVVGRGPAFWFGRLLTLPTMVLPFAALGGNSWLFVDQSMSLVADSPLPYQLLQGDSVIQEGTLPGGSGGIFEWIQPLSVQPGAYTMKVRGPSRQIAGVESQSLVSLTFDTTAADPSPPFISHLQVTTGRGRPVETVHAGQPVYVRFKAHDDVAVGTVHLWARLGTAGPWMPLPLHKTNDLYRAMLPTRGPLRSHEPIPVALKLEVTDTGGNSLTHVVAPALEVVRGPARPH